MPASRRHPKIIVHPSPLAGEGRAILEDCIRPIPILLALLLFTITTTRAAEPPLKHHGTNPATCGSVLVSVGNVPLLHTTQILPGDLTASTEAQIDDVLTRLDTLLRSADSDFEQLVKLNVTVRESAALNQFRKACERRFAKGNAPAISFVGGKLPRPDAMIGLDAVAVTRRDNPAKATLLSQGKPTSSKAPSDVAILPSGRKVYISGQAEGGENMGAATRKTLESLKRTLEHLGLSLADVVQLKSFLGPMTSIEESRQEFAKFFDDAPLPPLVFVEWSSSLPIEIELIAAAGPLPAGIAETVEFLTPPGMQASPVFSRVTRVTSPETIYISGLYGESDQNGSQEVREIFEQLKKGLADSNSDLEHLAKATYYVSTEDASNELNKQRPNHYHPSRPPAASKAMVAGTGLATKTITLDLIAVPIRSRK